MRISTNAMFAQEMAMLSKLYDKVGGLQLQMASGKKIQVGSDDPVLASRIVSSQDEIVLLNTYKNNQIIAKNRTELFESTSSGAVEQLKKVKQLITQAGNGTLSNSERSIIGGELQSIVNNLVGLASTKDSNGEYIYSGFNINNAPFLLVDGKYTYQGSSETSNIDVSIDATIKYSESGQDIFGNIFQGNGIFTINPGSAVNTGSASTSPGSLFNISAFIPDSYTLSFVTNSAGEIAYQVTGDSVGQVLPPPPANLPNDAPVYHPNSDIQFNGIIFHISGQPDVGDSFVIAPSRKENMFDTLSSLVSALKTPINTSADRAVYQQILSQTGSSFDQIFDHMNSIQSEFGTRANQLDSIISTNDSKILHQNIIWSSLSSADLAEVASELVQNMTSLQAAQQTYVKIQDLFQHMLKF